MLLASELVEIKKHLGYHLISSQGEPYIGFVAIFELIIQPFLATGPLTTSTTTVIKSGGMPTSTALTLASVAGITPGTVLVVDVDSLAETCTVQSVTGSTVQVLLGKPHQGTYPVVIQSTGVMTSSSTSVAAIVQPPTQVQLTVADGTGFTVGSRIVVDVGVLQEVSTLTSISGNSLVLALSNGHGGGFPYPVTQESGETIVRGILGKLRALVDVLNGGAPGGGSDALSDATASAGIQQVDEVIFFGGKGGATSSMAGNSLQQTLALQEYWRDELANALGLVRLNAPCGSSASIY